MAQDKSIKKNIKLPTGVHTIDFFQKHRLCPAKFVKNLFEFFYLLQSTPVSDKFFPT